MSAMDVQAQVRFARILFPTDCLDKTTVALKYAAGLARHFSSHLELANVIDLAQTFPTMDVLSGPALDSIRLTGKRDLENISAEISGIPFTTRVIDGFESATLILDEAVNTNVDLIVLGTNCKHGFSDTSLGARTAEIISSAPCPVLTIGPRVPPPEEGVISFQRILYATDFSTPARKAAAIAIGLGHVEGAKVYLCHVIDKKEESKHPGCDEASLASLRSLIPEEAKSWCSVECVVAHGKAAEGILGLANRVNADLIVLGAHKHSYWLSLIHSGIVAAVVASTHCPVLTVSAGKEL